MSLAKLRIETLGAHGSKWDGVLRSAPGGISISATVPAQRSGRQPMARQDSVDTAEIFLQPDPNRAFEAPFHIEVSALSHTGLVRSNNEDHFLVTRSGRSLQTILTNLPAGDIPEHFDTTG